MIEVKQIAKLIVEAYHLRGALGRAVVVGATKGRRGQAMGRALRRRPYCKCALAGPDLLARQVLRRQPATEIATRFQPLPSPDTRTDSEGHRRNSVGLGEGERFAVVVVVSKGIGRVLLFGLLTIFEARQLMQIE